MAWTYEKASGYLGTKQDRPLPGRSTRLQRRPDGGIAVRYHATDVITFHPDGRIVLQSGGYQTMTTKARINEYSPVQLYADRGLWYVANGTRTLYADGLTWAAGTITGGRAPAATEGAKRQLDRAVAKYIKGFCASVTEARALAAPSGGDCWGCLFQAETAPRTGNGWNSLPPYPAKVMGYDHYIDHFGGDPDNEDPYYVPALVWRAVQRCGSPAHVYQFDPGGRETRRYADAQGFAAIVLPQDQAGAVAGMGGALGATFGD